MAAFYIASRCELKIYHNRCSHNPFMNVFCHYFYPHIFISDIYTFARKPLRSKWPAETFNIRRLYCSPLRSKCKL